MDLNYVPEIWWFALAASLPLALCVRILARPTSTAERSFGWLLFAQTAWIFGQALELSVADPTAKLYADGLQYFPMSACGYLQMDFAHRFSGTRNNRWLSRGYLAITGSVSAFFFLAPLHGLARTDARVITGTPFDVLTYEFAPGDGILILFSFGAATYAVATLLAYVARTDRAHHASSVPILLGLGLPVAIAMAASTANLRVLGQRDVSFVMFGLGGLVVAWGLRNRRSVITVPIARDRVFDVFFDPVLVLSDADVVLEINEVGARALSLESRSSATGTSLGDLGDSFLARALLHLDEEEPRVVGPDEAGSYHEIKQRALPELSAKLVVIRDVTEREQARLLLLEDQQVLKHKFQVVFNQAFQLIGILDLEGRLVEANQIALSLSGVKASEVLGKPFWETPWWSHSKELQERLREGLDTARQGGLVRFDATHFDAEGNLRQVDFSLKPVLSEQGDVVMLVAEGRDITELRHTEEQLRQAQKMDALGRLAGGVAHDFNNLLTVMSGNLSMALESTAEPEVTEHLSHVEQAIDSATSLTSQLLAFGRKSLVQPKTLDVEEQLRRQVSMLRRVIPESISISCEVEPEVGSIAFDPAQFQQVVLNLAVNAKHAMPSGGKLVLSARKSRDDEGGSSQVRIEVADTGEGIEAEHLERIFDPFYTTKPQGQGTGLGLSMVYGAVSQHAGRVEVESKPGRGTRFCIILPQASGDPEESRTQPGLRRNLTSGKVVYVVEDEPALRRTLARVLTRHGFVEKTFESGVALLAQLSELSPPDLLLTDAVMPGISGYDLLEKLKDVWPETAVLVMSGYSEDERLRKVISEGANFIPKAFTPRDLIEAMFRALERKERAKVTEAAKG